MIDIKNINMKWVVFFISVPLLICLYFAENIKGYYRFKHFCNTEGGLTVYEKVEPDVGWMTKDKYRAESVANIVGVDFVRFPDKKNKDKYFDRQYVGGSRDYRDSAQNKEANLNKQVKYRYVLSTKRLPNELRLTKQSKQVWDISRNKLLVEHNSFNYAKYDRRKALLAVSGNIQCSRYTKTGFDKIFK